MTALPAKGDLDGTTGGHNQGMFKTAIGNLRDWAAGLFGTAGTVAGALDNFKLLDPRAVYNLSVGFAVGSNALTLTVKDSKGVDLSSTNPGFVMQRSSSVGNGTHNLRTISANASLVVSSGSTLGHTSATLRPIYVYLIDNAGTLEPAVSGGFMGESGIVTTVAEGGAGAADSPNTMYSATARTGVPFRLIAVAWSNQTTAGSWAAIPTEVRLPPFDLREVGEEVTYMGGAVPYGFYLEDGSNVSRTGDNAKLFGVTGTSWGVGDGSTTFGLPDSRRRTAVGKGGSGTATLGNAVGNTGGGETHTLITSEMPIHSHTMQRGNALGSGGDFPDGNNVGTTSTDNAGGDGAHNNMQPSMVVTKMIRWNGDIA